jgi:hypothetical protein
MPVQDIDLPARCGPTDAIDQETQPVTSWLSPKPAETQRRRQTRRRGDQIKQARQGTHRRALQRRPLAAVLIGQSARVGTRQHRREELDADCQADQQIAEPQLLVDEQRDHRQRQADAQIAAEQRRDNARCGC